MSAEARTGAWSRYWAAGATHSCAGDAGGTYTGSIGEFWRRSFSALVEPAHVLDIGCGNGPLARQLLQLRTEPGIRCDAVDLAAIAPDWAATESRVRFHAGVAAESLPFPDGHFDLVVSQYGIEYSALERSLPEAMRVCRRDGELRLAMHHAASRPCALAREELEHIDWLLQPDGWLAAAEAMVEPMHLAGFAEGQARLHRDAARFAPIRRRFDVRTAALHERRSTSNCPDVLNDAHNAAVKAFQAAHSGGSAAGNAALATLRQWLRDIHSRLQDMTAHALDDAGMAALSAALMRSGAYGEWTALLDRDAPMAVVLTVRPGA